ncbi:LacI family DNA-binding transcriptional regulator [Clostridium sp. Ade.TY]|uniref:LacI family DNA-binding transcriptional regulator n=1 Tax=Clostridium sp. Ade.TY TaxID=1391647 RepID=UPI00041DEFD4|nr:LacI family DNA-binding transcriptional regulator [Clostridium sp. Ade.TY]
MKVTIKDVAREANVAPSTVSRVISNSPKISEETKEKVNKAINKLNYKPNAIARSLVSNKTKILGVVLPNEADDLFKNPFFVEAMRGMSISAEEYGYHIMYAFSKNSEDELKSVKEFSSNNLLDGMCLLTVRENDKCIEYLKSINFPFVVIGRPDNEDDVLWVDNDNFKAMYDLVENLINDGYYNIAFIGGKKNWKVSKNRLNGFKKALEDNNIKYTLDSIVEGKDFTEECGYNAMKEILENDKPSVVVTTEDLLAFGANNFLRDNNIDGIKLIGFNNTPMAKYQNPPISSIDINARELGYQATKLLIESLNYNKEKKKSHYIVETEFIERI